MEPHRSTGLESMTVIARIKAAGRKTLEQKPRAYNSVALEQSLKSYTLVCKLEAEREGELTGNVMGFGISNATCRDIPSNLS